MFACFPRVGAGEEAASSVPPGLRWAIISGDTAEIDRSLAGHFSGAIPNDSPVVIYARTIKVIDFLSSKGASLFATDVKRRNVLMTASETGDAQYVGDLLTRIREVNAKDRTGRSPLHYSASNVSNEVAILLIDQGAIVDAQDSKGRTVLRCAAEYRSVAVFKLLLQRGADPLIVDCSDENVIEYVMRQIQIEQVDERMKALRGMEGELRAAGYIPSG